MTTGAKYERPSLLERHANQARRDKLNKVRSEDKTREGEIKCTLFDKRLSLADNYNLLDVRSEKSEDGTSLKSSDV